MTDKLEVMEVYPAWQGEGTRMGSASVFVRFARCNLKCTWCDTKYAWSKELLPHEHVDLLTPDELASRILEHVNFDDVVLTGGEPLLQHDGQLCALVDRLQTANRHVTIETSGSLVPSKHLSHVDLWSYSPKLTSSGNWRSNKGRDAYWSKVVEGVTQMWDGPNVQLKFVIADTDDVVDMLDLCSRISGHTDAGIPPLMVQPVGPNSTISGGHENVERTDLDDYSFKLQELETLVKEKVLPVFPSCRVLPQLHKIIHSQARLK